MEIKTIPLLDNYETTLSQEWNWQIWKMKVDDLPNIPVDSSGKFVDWFTTYVIVNPDKQNFQLAEIDGYNSAEKTLNVINVNLQKWLWLSYNFSHHNQKSVVRISNNFAFWKKIADVLNSKQDYWIWNISWDYFLNIDWILKFKDKNNSEITLSDIAWKIWQDKKVSIDWTDESMFLQNKLGKWFKISSYEDNKKIDIDYKNIDFSDILEEDFNNQTFLLSWNKKKINFFKKENLDFLNKNLWNIEAIAWENINTWDLVYFYPDKECKVFEGWIDWKRTESKAVQSIRLNNNNFRISKLGFICEQDSARIKIYTSYDFSNMTWSWLVTEFTLNNSNRITHQWFNVNLNPYTDYYVEIYGSYYSWSNVYARYRNNNFVFWDIRQYSERDRTSSIFTGYSYASDFQIFGWIQIKTTKTDRVFKNIDTSIFWSTRNNINASDICYDGVAITSASEWQNIIVKADWFLPKNWINFSWKTIWKFFWNYVKIWDVKNKKDFEDFIS